ncbi:hypothetical protein ES288_D08G168300v1 [Gossypium darwinii]|uniref:Uncharacterized protein n=1 Tax=Gossypium darwinii TaxID=34276 RepID=A0A5D2BPX1_GOSDA|nr:hypothetical protein ES288_D08G168300v1 [Gossypium darwinii]
MKESFETHGQNEAATTIGIWDCGSPLYDSYELVSLSHLIERHLMKLPYLGGSKRLTTATTFSYPSDLTLPTIAADSYTSNARAKGSYSLMNSLTEFLGTKFWKRRRMFGHKRKKPNKKSTTFI